MHGYRFGNTSLSFESSDATWLSYLGERYDSFRDQDPSNAFEVRFECTDPRLPEGMTSPLSTRLEAPVIEVNPGGFTARTATTFADVDLDARRARIRGPRALYPVDNLFRHLLPALGEQGALVHGAALSSDASEGSRGVLACGPSGAGKSTLARLAGAHALCDELAAVDGCRLTSLPFWHARPGSVGLSAVLLLQHGREHRLDPVPPTEALRRVARQVLWPVELPSAMERTLTHVAAVVERVPVFELSFRPDPDVWRFIVDEVLS